MSYRDIDQDFYYVISNMSRGPGILLTLTQSGVAPGVNMAFRATQLGQLSYQLWSIRHPDGGYTYNYSIANMSTGSGLRLGVPKDGPSSGVACMAASDVGSMTQIWIFNDIASEYTAQGYLRMSTLQVFGSFLDIANSGGAPNQAVIKPRLPYSLSQAWLLTKTAIRI